jgi:hypothetical protein
VTIGAPQFLSMIFNRSLMLLEYVFLCCGSLGGHAPVVSTCVAVEVEIRTTATFRLIDLLEFMLALYPEDGEVWTALVKELFKPLSEKILISNKHVIGDVAKGIAECEDFYPIECDDDRTPTYVSCKVGLLACSKSTGEYPAVSNADRTHSLDLASGFVVFILGMFIVLFCFFWLASMVPKLFTGVQKRIIKRGTSINGYLSIFIGTGFTKFIGSLSVALSFVPSLVGTALVGLEEMFPYSFTRMVTN